MCQNRAGKRLVGAGRELFPSGSARHPFALALTGADKHQPDFGGLLTELAAHTQAGAVALQTVGAKLAERTAFISATRQLTSDKERVRRDGREYIRRPIRGGFISGCANRGRCPGYIPTSLRLASRPPREARPECSRG
jgi:hypothetical protein